jgi:hypothetical protein
MRNRWIKATLFTLAGILALCIAVGAEALDWTVAKRAESYATRPSVKDAIPCAGTVRS